MTTDSRHSCGIAPNLLDRNFRIAPPDKVWLAGIPYISTGEGWLCLAAVKDLATMEIVGWSMSNHLKSTLCEDALKMAIRNRRPPTRPDSPFRSRRPGRLRRVSQAARSAWRHRIDEPQGQLSGQRPDGKLLQLAENREGSSDTVSNPAPGRGRAVRVHRDLLQPAAAAFEYRLSDTGSSKDGYDDQARSMIKLAPCPGSRGKVKAVRDRDSTE